MDKFFTALRKSLVAIMFVMFTTMATFVLPPQGGVQTAHATLPTFDVPDFVVEIISNVWETVVQGIQAGIEGLADVMWNKEWTLDQIVWTATKELVGMMMDDMIAWIQSGFKGRPMFVQDIEGHLREVADRAAFEYLAEVTGTGSLLCDPFKLDIGMALDVYYNRTTDERYERDACTLTGALENIEGFMDGAQGSFSRNGGWDAWFDITSSPSTYTPYGAGLAAQQTFDARILQARNEETKLLDWGNGLLSHKKCEQITTADGAPKEECEVVTPGKVVQEALSFNIDSQRQALIEADEVNELVGSLIQAIGREALGGAGGLLDV